MSTLPTPEEIAKTFTRYDTEMIEAYVDVIAADREAIAKAVESLRDEPELGELPGNEAGYEAALEDVLALLRSPK